MKNNVKFRAALDRSVITKIIYREERVKKYDGATYKLLPKKSVWFGLKTYPAGYYLCGEYATNGFTYPSWYIPDVDNETKDVDGVLYFKPFVSFYAKNKKLYTTCFDTNKEMTDFLKEHFMDMIHFEN